jgi:hypothetical protein
MLVNFGDLFYRPKLKLLRKISKNFYFQKFPERTAWTKWSEIDSNFGLLSSDLYFNKFRRCKLLIETMDYQNLDAKKYSKLLKSSGFKEPKFGSPIKPFMLRNSLNAGHQYKHIIKYTKSTNININSHKRIIEFGGGYGCMRWLISKHNYKGQYEIVENPGIRNLQERYLRLSLTPLDFERTNWNQTIKDLVPNLKSDDLFIGLWSVSETPTEVMLEILESLEITQCHLLLAFQHNFNGRDNRSYFDKYFKSALREEIAYPANNFHSTYIFR